MSGDQEGCLPGMCHSAALGGGGGTSVVNVDKNTEKKLSKTIWEAVTLFLGTHYIFVQNSGMSSSLDKWTGNVPWMVEILTCSVAGTFKTVM